MNTQTDTGPDDHPLEDNTRPSLFICLLLVDEGACDEGAGPNDGGIHCLACCVQPEIPQQTIGLR